MSNNKTTYKVNAFLVGELLTGSHNFRVPEFQRSYVWSSSSNPKKEREVNLLFEDILTSNENNENYYIGSIITYPGDHYEHLLVDGQQRITTLMILLIAFRNFQNSLEDSENTKKFDVEKYLKFEQDTGKKKEIIHKLKVSNSIGQNFFFNLLENSPELNKVEAGSREMADAYDASYEFISDLGLEKSIKFLEYILDHVEISWIEANDIVSAFVVFERMNDRGKDLTVADKFKYLLFQNNSAEELDSQNSSINQEWEHLTTSLSEYENTQKPKMDRFLSYFLAARFYTDDFPTARGMINWIRTENNMKLVGVNKPNSLLKLMKKDMSRFGSFLQGLNIDGTQNESLQNIKKYAWDVRQHIPILLAGSIREPSLEQFNKLALSMEQLTFALKISGAQWNTIEKLIPTWCTALRDDITINKFIKDFVRPEIENRKVEIMANLTNTENINPTVRSFVLEKINNIVSIAAYEPIVESTGEGREKATTVEHILPQNFSSESAKTQEELKVLKKSINRLGNLTLLERVSNSAAGNLDVAEKFNREIFKDSKYLVSRVIQVDNFSGDNAQKKKHKAVFKKYNIEKIELDQSKYWNLSHIEQREKFYFTVLSEYFEMEITPLIID